MINFTKPIMLDAITFALTIPLTFITSEAQSGQRGKATWYPGLQKGT